MGACFFLKFLILGCFFLRLPLVHYYYYRGLFLFLLMPLLHCVEFDY